MTATTAWNDMSELEQLAVEYSDYHKEVFNFRPRSAAPDTVEGLQKAIKELDVIQRIDEESERQWQEEKKKIDAAKIQDRRNDDQQYKEADTRFAALRGLK